ncbi:MAG TPA: hypothetical protein VK633_15670 [Verrucomicrobiae bacterium]|nr:hypothetical protein [Verrucomicrobiae bacterium]
MKFAQPILKFALLIVVAVGLWIFLFPAPEKVIRKKLEKLAQTVSENPQGNISRVANVNRIGSFFHPKISINLEGFGREVASINGRGELEQMALGVRQNNFRISVRFSTIHIVVDADESNATAIVGAEVKLNEQAEPIVQDLHVRLEKVDRAWLIRSVEPAKAFKVE